MLHAGRNVKDNWDNDLIDEQPSLGEEELCDNDGKHFC